MPPAGILPFVFLSGRLPDVRLNHRQLEAFRAIMQTGMVTRAADLLNVTQPAISRLLADLEHAVGFPLFERAKGRLFPTVEAKLLITEVERSFSGLDKISRFAQGIRQFEHGSLTIAAMPAMGLGFLPRVITRFAEAHPKVRFRLATQSSPEVLESVATQQYDLGFATVHAEHAAVRIEPWRVSQLVCVLRPDHPLAHADVIRAPDLRGERFVSLGPESGIRQRINLAFEDAGVPINLVIESQLSATVCAFVRAGAGVALVDPISASEFLSQGLIARRFELAIPYTYSLLLPVHRSRSRLVDPFLELAKAMCSESPVV